MENYLVVKHNNLVEARYYLTLQEQKLVASVVSKIKPNDVDFQDYRITAKEFMEHMEVEADNYTQIIKCAKSLLKKPIVIQENGNDFAYNWFSAIEYYKGVGIIVFRFDPGLKPYLLQLKNCFTAYRIINIMHLTSIFAIRLYELLKQYLLIGRRTFRIDDLKIILAIEDKYIQYNHFDQKVLVIAKREINEKSDMWIEYEPIKTGRKVTAVEFIIDENPTKREQLQLPAPSIQLPAPPPIPNDIIADQSPIESLTFPGTSPELIRLTIAEIGIEAVTEIHTAFVTQLKKAQSGKGKRIDDPAAYYANSLRNRIGVKTPAQRQAAKDKTARLEKSRQEKAQEETRVVQKAQADKAEQERLEKLVAALSASDRERLRSLALKLMPQSMTRVKASVKNRMESLAEDFIAGKLN